MPLLVFGLVGVVNGFTAMLLPETLGRKLPETVQDAIDFGRWVDGKADWQAGRQTGMHTGRQT